MKYIIIVIQKGIKVSSPQENLTPDNQQKYPSSTVDFRYRTYVKKIRVPYPKGARRNPITNTPLSSVRPSVCQLTVSHEP